MPHSAIWELFGGIITEHHARTLAAYLGDRDAELALDAESIPFPTSDDFRSDPVFDPNPHRLDLSSGYVETALLVHSVAVWGPDALIRAAFACAKLQVEHQTVCNPELVGARDAALQAVGSYLQSATDERLQEVVAVAGWCNELYSPHEEDPDTEEAQTVWTQLGAAWFAAETASQDFKLESYDGTGPREGSSTWCKRNVVWPVCAAEVAACLSSHNDVCVTIRTALLDWIDGASAQSTGPCSATG